jgi:4-hydroxy-tetrahydrodipicolinate reductase
MLAMHMQQAQRTGSFMQVVNILRYNEQLARPLRIQPRQRIMRGVRLYLLYPRAAHVVKAVDQIGIAGKGLRRCNILDPVLFPQAAFVAEGVNATFGADAGASEDDDVADHDKTRVPELVEGLSFLCRRAKGKSSPSTSSGRTDWGALAIMARIGIIGSAGRMGQALAQAIAEAGHQPSGGVDRGDDAAALAAVSDALVDFSAPDALEANLDAAVAAGIPMVVGTTGLAERHHYLIDDAARDVAVLQTGNTSLGVTLLAHLVRDAAARLGPDWDIEIVEMHHRHKVDAPSGTALLLGEAAAAGRGIELAEHSERGRDGDTGARASGAIGFASLRGGSVPGDHSVIIAGEGESLTLSHRAEDRAIFARGAVKAAEWLIGRAAGRYAMGDVLGL